MLNRVKNLDLRLVAIASLVAGILFSLALSWFVWTLLASEARDEFKHLTSLETEKVEKTLQLYSEILYGMKGTFVASQSVTGEAFERHVTLLRLAQRYPGLQALAFIRRNPDATRPDPGKSGNFAGRLSSVKWTDHSGSSGLRKPPAFVTAFIEPSTQKKQLLGFGPSDRAKWRAAIEEARDTGKAVATGPLELPRESAPRVVIMVHLPIYRGGKDPKTVRKRRRDFFGVVTAIFRMRTLIKSALGAKINHFDLRINDLGSYLTRFGNDPRQEKQFLYRAAQQKFNLEDAGLTGLFHRRKFWRSRHRLKFAGRIWQISYTQPVELEAGLDRVLPLGTAAVGILFFALLFWFLRLGAQTLERLRLAANVFNNSIQAIAITDAKNKIVKINPAFSQITGYSAEEVRGQDPRILKSELQSREFYQEMWSSVLETGQWVGELWNRRKDGVLYPGWMTISTVKNEKGEVTYHVGAFTDITKQKEMEHHLDFLAQHDPLTQLPNRLLFQDRIQQSLALSRRNKDLMAVLALDLDRFKTINDTLGHTIGDRLLKDTAGRLKDILRRNDTVARLGGDEFVVLISQCRKVKDIALVAEKILAELSRTMLLEGTELHLSVSIGISIFPNDGEDAETLIKNANAALSRAQKEGPSKYMFYTDDMNARAFERLSLENQLRRAIDREELELYYQPRIDFRRQALIGAEALVRWRHPELGLVPPGQFIPIAEETGLILPLGLWVLRRACAQSRLWREEGRAPLPVSVNVSALQLQRPDFVDQVRQTLEETGCNPQALELELTESMLMKNPEEIIPKLEELKGLGVHFAIDDFGTGYSSLSYLKRFPVDILKIDRSFVQNIPGTEEDVALIRAIIGLAESLRLHVVAEGVETREQRDFLAKEGCDWIQGYFFSKPLPLAEFERYRDAKGWRAVKGER